jgi:excisionase family DNA binding protein
MIVTITPPAEPLAVDMKEAARLLSISDDTLGRLIAAGEIATFKIGALRRIEVAELRAFIARRKDGR